MSRSFVLIDLFFSLVLPCDCYEDVVCRCHNIVTRGDDLNSFPWWKPSLIVQLVGGSDGCCVQRNDVIGRLEVVLESCIVLTKVGFNRMKRGQG